MRSRSLSLLALVLISGCSCDFEVFPPDECSDDLDCPDDPAGFCNGAGVCEGWLSTTCAIREPDCAGGYCDPVSDSCQACTSPDDAPECFYLVDAGGTIDGGASICGEGGPSEVIGAACPAGCAPGMACLPETGAVLGTIERTFASLCSPLCDPGAAESGCEPCAATCVDAVRVGGAQVPVSDVGRDPFCAVRCEPTPSSTGCARPDFSCDVVTGTCQDACASDQECRLVRDASGELIEDPTRTHVCDALTGRCRSPGTPGARIGDPCELDADCTVDGICLRGDGWPDVGYCARLDCQWPALACGAGAQCHHRALERPACLVACTVGAELPSDQLGAGGHGAGCAPGMSCRWDGRSGDVSPNGGCVPGNYNDVLAPNLGEPCASDDECHSPFGLGRCAFADGGAGICSLVDCGGAHPGIACGDGASCVQLGDDALCLRSCATASECADGHACAPEPSGGLVCVPGCTEDADCRAGERCDGTECAFGGACRCVAP